MPDINDAIGQQALSAVPGVGALQAEVFTPPPVGQMQKALEDSGLNSPAAQAVGNAMGKAFGNREGGSLLEQCQESGNCSAGLVVSLVLREAGRALGTAGDQLSVDGLAEKLKSQGFHKMPLSEAVKSQSIFRRGSAHEPILPNISPDYEKK